jgi:hypothetical protein
MPFMTELKNFTYVLIAWGLDPVEGAEGRVDFFAFRGADSDDYGSTFQQGLKGNYRKGSTLPRP